MQLASILNIVAALVVIAYFAIRIHALQWSKAPLQMFSCLALAFCSALVAAAPMIGLEPANMIETMLHLGLAFNCFANWDRARFDQMVACSCPVEFKL